MASASIQPDSSTISLDRNRRSLRRLVRRLVFEPSRLKRWKSVGRAGSAKGQVLGGCSLSDRAHHPGPHWHSAFSLHVVDPPQAGLIDHATVCQSLRPSHQIAKRDRLAVQALNLPAPEDVADRGIFLAGWGNSMRQGPKQQRMDDQPFWLAEHCAKDERHTNTRTIDGKANRLGWTPTAGRRASRRRK